MSSLREAHAPQPDRRLVSALNQCISACIDGEKSYALAAADVRDPGLKALFLRYEKERAGFAATLQDLVERLGAFSLNEGSTRGMAQRGWNAVVRVAFGPSDRLVVEHLARGERLTLQTYADAFRDEVFRKEPTDLESIIEHQYDACLGALTELCRRLGQFDLHA